VSTYVASMFFNLARGKYTPLEVWQCVLTLFTRVICMLDELIGMGCGCSTCISIYVVSPMVRSCLTIITMSSNMLSFMFVFYYRIETLNCLEAP